MEEKRVLSNVVLLFSVRLNEEEAEMIRKKGYTIILLKDNLINKEDFFYDYIYDIDIINKENILRFFSEINSSCKICRIIAFNDEYHCIAAWCAKKLGIPYWGLGVDIVERFVSKKIQRTILETRDIPCAHGIVIRNEDGLKKAIETTISFPLIIKPSVGTGGYNVYRCDTYEELEDKYYKIVFDSEKNTISENKEVILEEFLEGKQYSVETISIEGQHFCVAVTETVILNVAEVMHTVPAMIPQCLEDEMKSITINALNALKFMYGNTHTQLKLTAKGIKIIEINGRPSGGYIPEIVRAVYGVDMRKTHINIMLDGPEAKVVKSPSLSQSATAILLYSEQKGKYRQLIIPSTILENYKINLVCEWKKRGDIVNAIYCDLDRLGGIIVLGKKDESKEAAKTITKKIILEIE